MKKLAIFRCDASPAIGAGHAARCLALADAFAESGADILFATNGEAEATFPALAKHRLEVVPRDLTDEPAWLRNLAEDLRASLVIDLPRASTNYESQCRSWAYKVAVIADFPDRKFDCDIVVDQTIGRMASEYTPLVPANCTPLTGAQYALVGKSFRALRGEAGKRRKEAAAQRLLIAFGATDPFNYLGRLLPALVQTAPELKIVIAAGSRPLRDVNALCEMHADRIFVLHTAEEMPRALLDADLAVGLAGTSAWERCLLGLPAALFIPSHYYRLATEGLAASGAAVIIGGNNFDATEATEEITKLAADGAALARMSEKAFALCDGEGASRIVNALR
jgi:UDP-2,4-diacetamido-2,4,6-trideoxy-beta-L-altropyranose hydrolase